MALFSVLVILTVAAGFASIMLVFLTLLHLKHLRYVHLPGPPRSNFLLGHLTDIVAYNKKGQNLNHFLYDCYLEHGKLFLVWFFTKPYVFLADPQSIRDILIERKDPKEMEIYGLLAYIRGERFLGKGIVTNVDFESWEASHKLISPAFKRSYLRGLMDQFNASTDLFIHHLEGKADGFTEVPMYTEFPRVTMDTIAKVAFDMEIEVFNEDPSPVSVGLNRAFAAFRESVNNPLFRFGLVKREMSRHGREGARQVRALAGSCIKERLQKVRQGLEVPKDILTMIVQGAVSEKTHFSLEEMIDEFVTLFIAGTDTTACLLSFTLLELSKNPDALERVQKEVSETLGGRHQISFDNLAQLQYLGQALKEVLRRHPPVAGSGRELQEAAKIGTYQIPAHTVVASTTYVAHHVPEHFTDPFTFNPDRFEPSNNPPSVFQYLPFSVGPRSCLGKNFAQIESKVVMSRFIQSFQFDLIPGQEEGTSLLVSLAPRSNLLCTLTRR